MEKICYSEKLKNLNKLLIFEAVPQLSGEHADLVKRQVNSAEIKVKYSTTLDCACSENPDFLGKVVSSRRQATDSKLCIELYFIKYYATSIRMIQKVFQF